MPRIIITMNGTELAGLIRLAQAELRRPQDQLRFLLREKLLKIELDKHEEDASGRQFNLPFGEGDHDEGESSHALSNR